MPPIVATPHMARWDRWGRQVLRDGDIVFRLGDARLAHGYFPMSRFLASASNSKFSHTGIVAIEEEGPVVYDTTRTGVARQPFCVWVLDNIGSIGVKRLRPEYKDAIPKVVAYCRKVFEEQVPFDYELSDDDTALYCVEMTEKAYRAAGIELSEPIRLGDMERASEFPLACSGMRIRLAVRAGASADVRPARLLPRQRTPRDLVGPPTDDGRCPHLRARPSRLLSARLPRRPPKARKVPPQRVSLRAASTRQATATGGPRPIRARRAKTARRGKGSRWRRRPDAVGGIA